MKATDFLALVTERARKMSVEQIVRYFNNQIRLDNKINMRRKWGDILKSTASFDVETGTNTFTLPTDFQKLTKVTDKNLKKYFRGFGDAKVQISNKEITFPEKTSETYTIEYWKKFPVLNTSDALVLDDEIVDTMLPIWTHGLEFFYFSDRKKIIERDVADGNYVDAKTMVFPSKVTSI